MFLNHNICLTSGYLFPEREDSKVYATYCYIPKEDCVSGLNYTRDSNVIC